MYFVRYNKSDGRVNMIGENRADMIPVEGHDIAELERFPVSKAGKVMYFIDGELVYKEVDNG